ncbi:MAG TPA: polymorphic toxin type 5 domain-containing protein [Jatrophihabitans sp.]|nr:polymorphic toxin type 5 domain-containing protein [Jatrophihabitans sp.]
MAGERTFMDQALNIINNTSNHPLSFLVDPETGKWWGRSPYGAAFDDHPTVQAGHRLSRSAGGEHLAVQDGFSNQLEGRVVEGRGNPVQREAIEIGGIPVDPLDAKFWEKEGLLPPGTVANAPIVPGWQPGDTLVAPPPGAFTGTHEESLPGGPGTVTITADGASEVLMAGMSDLAWLLGGGVSVMGTLALMDTLADLADDLGLADDDEGEPDDPPTNEPPAKEPPRTDPPKDPPAKEAPPKDPPPKEAPKDPPPKEAPPQAPPPPEPPATPPPATGGGGDSSGGIPGASGGGDSPAPEGSTPGGSGATSSLTTDDTALLAFSYSPSDDLATADTAGDAPTNPGLVDGFGVPGPDGGFDIPAPDSDFDVPAPDGGFDVRGHPTSGDFDDDFAVPPSFDGGPR